MSGKGDKKSKRRRRDKDRVDVDDDVVRGSGVDYSKVADRHVDDERFERQKQTAGSNPSAAVDSAPADSGATPAAQPKVSSQMAAVMRLMAGMEERTIAQKLADSNRPTWEQYKKDNEDKLDLVGADMKKMEAYRKELDEQRDKLLTRGTNHKKEGKDKDEKKSRKKKRKKHRRHDDSYSSESDSSDGYSSDDDRKDRKRKKHKKKSSGGKHDRKKSSRRHDSDSHGSEDDRKKSSKHRREKSKKKKTGDGDSSSGDSYRLSSFFAKGSDEESR